MEKDLLESFETNVVGTAHLFTLFLPLIRQGSEKKVIAISSGMADLELVGVDEVEVASSYATSKAAMNMMVAKFSARYRKEGILFMSICPGLVDTGNITPADSTSIYSHSAEYHKLIVSTQCLKIRQRGSQS